MAAAQSARAADLGRAWRRPGVAAGRMAVVWTAVAEGVIVVDASPARLAAVGLVLGPGGGVVPTVPPAAGTTAPVRPVEVAWTPRQVDIIDHM